MPSSSGSDRTTSDTAQASTSTTSKARTKLPLRRPIPRKGHTKSRLGCYNCKKRKIKCQEKHPECDHCAKAGLLCRYPPPPGPPAAAVAAAAMAALHVPYGAHHQHHHYHGHADYYYQSASPPHSTPSPCQLVQLHSTPGSFTAGDMKLFHHFMTEAYPHFPVGAASVWRNEIPQYSYNYDFLIHALLALSASHLAAITTSNGMSPEALRHQVLAVRSFNTALSQPIRSQTDHDALLATALALTFQASYIPDGLTDFFTMIRGCNVVAGANRHQDHRHYQYQSSSASSASPPDATSASTTHGPDPPLVMDPSSAFRTFRWDGHVETMERRLRALDESPMDPHLLDGTMQSLDALDQLCIEPYEIDYLRRLKTVIRCSYDNPLEAYASFAGLFNYPSRLPPASFSRFIDPANITAQLLLGHYISLFIVLAPLLKYEHVGADDGEDDEGGGGGSGGGKQDSSSKRAPTAVLSWLGAIYHRLPNEWRGFLMWPVGVMERVVGEMG